MEVYPSKKSWFQRNWLWFLPSSGCLVLIGIVLFFVSAAFYNFSKVFTDFTDEVTETMPIDRPMQRASEYDYVTSKLGEPLRFVETRATNYQIFNGKKEVTSETLIEGPKGTAILYLTGKKTKEIWRYSSMYLVLTESGEDINLFYDGEVSW